MKIRTRCMQCSKEAPLIQPTEQYVEITDDFVSLLLCERGHKSVIYMQEPKFEVLFDMGALALLDGYTRESVASLAAALERFYEFCICVFLKHSNVDDNHFTRSWKYVESQSERQLGAFLFLYTCIFQQHLNYQPIDEQVKFRNGVIHKGKIPKVEDVIQYGEILLSWMFSILKEIRRNLKDPLRQTLFFYIKQRMKKANELLKSNPGAKLIGMGSPTIIHLPLADELFGKKTFSESLAELSTHRNRFYQTAVNPLSPS